MPQRLAHRRPRRRVPKPNALRAASRSTAGKPRSRYCVPQAGVRRSTSKPVSSAMRVQGLRSAEWSQPQPRSSETPAPCCVQARPPRRGNASRITADSPERASRRAAPMPAAPAPTMAMSGSWFMKTGERCVASRVVREPEQAAQSRQVRVRTEAWSMTLEAPSRCEFADHQRLASRVAHELDRRVDPGG